MERGRVPTAIFPFKSDRICKSFLSFLAIIKEEELWLGSGPLVNAVVAMSLIPNLSLAR